MDVPKLYVNVVCLLILIPASEERPARQHHARFKNKHNMKDIIFQQDLIKELKASRVGCASQCHIQTTCKSYFYNKSTRRCRLHSTIFTDTTGAIPTEGWDYYGRHATSVKRNMAKTTAKAPDSESSADITASTGTTQSSGVEVSEEVRSSPGTTEERTVTEAGLETSPSDTSTQKSRLLSTLAARYRSRTSSGTEMGGAKENRLTSRMVTKPFVKLWTVTPESLPPGKLASMSTRDSLSTMEGGIKRASGSHVTTGPTGNVISSSRTSTSSTTTASSISSASSTSTSIPTTDRDTTRNANTHFSQPVLSTPGSRSDDDNTSPRTDNMTETDSSTSLISKDTTVGNIGQVVPTSDHNEDQHDELNLLTTEDHAQLFELSTGLAIPTETTGDEDDDEAGTITVMMVFGDDDDDDDDDDDESETTKFMMGHDVESTVSVISIGGDDDDHEHHHHILGHDVDDDGEVSSTTDVSAITPERGPQHEGHAGKTTERKSPYATLRLDKSMANSGSSESPTSTGSSVAGKVAAYVVFGVVLPLLGAVGYAVYRRWRTGSWILLHKQDESLSLQLVSSTDGLTM
ncbi:serine-rich adhesin for platelets-like [Haliotis asinina]|uniref:serine-rich adhesin for platelets-like n=1 Tax=Haliotis asinina TaxID=109174 RepID=UPI00353195E4